MKDVNADWFLKILSESNAAKYHLITSSQNQDDIENANHHENGDKTNLLMDE